VHICFLSSLHPPLDKRVHYKEAISLVKAGFEVTHIAQGDVDGEIIDGVRFVCFSGRKNVIGRLSQLRVLYRLAKQVKADVYHCNEIESWMTGVFLKIRGRCRVVFDVHEVYSTNVSERLFARPLRPMVEFLVRVYFRMLLPFTDRLVFAKQSVQKDFPILPAKTVLARNYTETEGVTTEVRAAPGDNVTTALHLGAINRGRGWPQLLEALTRVKNDNIRVSVVGRFGDGTEDQFRDELLKRGLTERVTFTPWIPYEDVPGYTAKCQIGLITFQPVHDNFTNALPHKLFDYMLAGLPVIVPDFAVEVREIVADSGCGILVDTTKPDDIAAALDKLADDPDLRRTMGERGRRAVLDRYNWEKEAKTLIAMYREIQDEIAQIA